MTVTTPMTMTTAMAMAMATTKTTMTTIIFSNFGFSDSQRAHGHTRSVREHPDAYAPSNAGRRGMSREAYAPLVLYYVLSIFSYI